MRTRCMWFVLFCLVTLYPWSSHAQWTRLNGPEGASLLSAFTTPGGTVLVGTLGGGVYRSDDGGGTWSFASAGLTDLDIYSLGGNGNRVYAGTRGGGMFSSSDDGMTWHPVTPAGPFALVKAILANDAVVLYANASKQLHRSTDAGATWNVVAGAPSASSIVKLIAAAGSICAVDEYGSVYRTSDNGLSWTKVEPGHDEHINALAAWTGNRTVMATDGGVHVSSDNLQTWIPMNAGLPGSAVHLVFADDAGALYAAATSAGIFRWNQTASSWEDANGSLTPEWVVAFSDLPGADFLVFCSRQFAQRWNAASATWTPVMKGLAAPRLYSIARDGAGNLYAGGAYGFVYKTTDSGNSWSQFFSGPTFQIVNGIVPISSTTYVLGTQGDGVYHTTDNGMTWGQQNSGLISTTIYGMHRSGGNLIYAATNSGLYYAGGTGQNWYAADSRYPNYCSAVSGSGSHVAAAFDSGRVLISDDDGAQWRMSQLPTTKSVVIVKRLPWSTLIAAVESEGLYSSTDEGATWQLLTAQFASAYPGDLLALGNEELYYATYGMGVWRSTDRGVSWIEMNEGLTINRLSTLIVGADGHLYACSQGAGVFRSTDRVLTVERDRAAFADGITLLGCAPMPCAGEGTIRFSTTAQDEATLTVYDVTGRRVFEHRKSIQSGENFFSVETSGLQPGVYHFRIAAGDAARSGRFIVMQ